MNIGYARKGLDAFGFFSSLVRNRQNLYSYR